ncbi:MAG TPA: universal stress protein [Actinomycetales bacterium]|nr:universal stress protein [Actinomycetales bacterium]
MISRIMLAVDDTPDSVAAARVAVDLAAALHAALRVVHVGTDHALDAAVTRAGGRGAVGARRAEADAAVLARAVALAADAGVTAETDLLAGDIGPAVLDAASGWPADLVVLGRSARSATGEPYIGSRARHILEFAEQPVLVVPPRPHR